MGKDIVLTPVLSPLRIQLRALGIEGERITVKTRLNESLAQDHVPVFVEEQLPSFIMLEEQIGLRTRVVSVSDR